MIRCFRRIHHRFNHRIISSTRSFSEILISPEVKDAIARNVPVVALESTIISHGMPYPRNLEVATQIEEAVRQAGAIPATVAIIGGIAKVGLTTSDLTLLSSPPSDSPSSPPALVAKASASSLSYLIGEGERLRHAGTTVSATMILAHRAGIRVFATGGIGGVHRGGESSMDISADLTELSRTPVTVVCAGTKAVLDIPRTLQVLETLGVPVLGYQTASFPAFFYTHSGESSPHVVSSPSQVARIIHSNKLLGLPNGILLAVPPPEDSVLEREMIETVITEALEQLKRDKVTGAAITPYLLEAVRLATNNASLETNIALVLNNARVASEVAIELASLSPSFTPSLSLSLSSQNLSDTTSTDSSSLSLSPSSSDTDSSSLSLSPSHEDIHGTDSDSPPLSLSLIAEPHSFSRPPSSSLSLSLPRVIVVGAAVMDFIASPRPSPHPDLIVGSSCPGVMKRLFGGVARNIAQALTSYTPTSRLSFSLSPNHSLSPLRVSLVSVVGNDEMGRELMRDTSERGIDISLVHVCEERERERENENATATATYTAIHSQNGELLAGIAHMDIMSRLSTAGLAAELEYIQKLLAGIAHMDIMSRLSTAGLAAELEYIQKEKDKLQEKEREKEGSLAVVVDGNLSVSSFSELTSICSSYSRFIPLIFEPTSDAKCTLPLQANSIHSIDLITPNLSELLRMAYWCRENKMVKGPRTALKLLLERASRAGALEAEGGKGGKGGQRSVMLDLYMHSEIAVIATVVMNVMRGYKGAVGEREREILPPKHILITLGSDGVLWVGPTEQVSPAVTPSLSHSHDTEDYESATINDDGTAWLHLPARPLPVSMPVTNTNGAGDALLAGIVSSMMQPRAVTSSLSSSLSSSSSLSLSLENVLDGMEASRQHLIRLQKAQK
eukprot:CAMPEP_0182438252 /NCGR_PEP_ID=MMETSP1167-20130531/85630_1 /TAXON_ID=2988 /ORGANISM="Mallomonas Sp, Strain CCMP3275" /LENGTH=900 /DNA_ID=CAMNT_0024631523 /DNA_START=154 /DNA_END=2856 /DNA_ORIENTATION=-